MKNKWMIVVWVVVALFALSIAKDLIVKISVEKGVEFATGLKIGIRSMNVGIFKTAVRIKGLKVFNPRQFKDRLMVDMPEIYVDYDLPAILTGNIHLKNLRINLKEFVVVKNQKGELNLNSLKVAGGGKEGEKPAGKDGKEIKMQIDLLELKIDKAFYKDYSAGAEPSIKEYDINLDERYTNITNLYALVGIIVVKALGNTSIVSLTGFDINNVHGYVGDAFSRAKNMAGRATGALGDIFKDVIKNEKF